MKVSTNIVITLLLVCFSSSAQTAMYKSTDAQGNVTYSQAPPKSGKYKAIKAKKFKRVPAGINQKSLKAQQTFETGAKVRKEENLVKAELRKNTKIQQQNCKRAKQNLRTYTLYRKLKDDKGEYYRVSDTEKAQGIKTAKGNIKQFCK